MDNNNNMAINFKGFMSDIKKGAGVAKRVYKKVDKYTLPGQVGIGLSKFSKDSRDAKKSKKAAKKGFTKLVRTKAQQDFLKSTDGARSYNPKNESRKDTVNYNKFVKAAKEKYKHLK